MSKTRTDLVLRVLLDLNVIDAATTTPDTEDSTYVTSVHDDKYWELNDRELLYWGIDDIPDPIFLAMVELIKNEVRPKYGEPQTPEDKESREVILLKQFRRHMRKRPSGLPNKAMYF